MSARSPRRRSSARSGTIRARSPSCSQTKNTSMCEGSARSEPIESRSRSMPATRPGIGFGAGIERLLLSIGSDRAEPSHIDVFFVCEQDGDRARIVPLLAELRRRGLRADMDYAGRSTKGQLTQAARLGAGWTVIVDGRAATVRQQGREDFTAALDAVVDRITG